MSDDSDVSDVSLDSVKPAPAPPQAAAPKPAAPAAAPPAAAAQAPPLAPAAQGHRGSLLDTSNAHLANMLSKAKQKHESDSSEDDEWD